jgi:hypothetical protein
MFQYHPTHGERGEILVERAGNFIGFIVNLGRLDLWAAYDRRLKPIGEGYRSRGKAATACLHDCVGKPKIPVRDFVAVATLSCTRSGIPATAEQAGAQKSAGHLAVQGGRSPLAYMIDLEPDDSEDDARAVAKLILAMILLCLLLAAAIVGLIYFLWSRL